LEEADKSTLVNGEEEEGEVERGDVE